jgi:hypothetical protein
MTSAIFVLKEDPLIPAAETSGSVELAAGDVDNRAATDIAKGNRNPRFFIAPPA